MRHFWGELLGLGDFAVINPGGEGRKLHWYSWGATGQIADLARMPAIAEAHGIDVEPGRAYAIGGSMGGQETVLLVAHGRDAGDRAPAAGARALRPASVERRPGAAGQARAGAERLTSALSRSAIRSSGDSIPTDSRTRFAGAANGDEAVEAWVIRAGCSIRLSTPPSDSASWKSSVRATSSTASASDAARNDTIPPKSRI